MTSKGLVRRMFYLVVFIDPTETWIKFLSTKQPGFIYFKANFKMSILSYFSLVIYNTVL